VVRGVKGPVMSVLARTLKSDVDLAIAALGDVSPFKRCVSLFIGTSPVHRRDKHGMSKAQVIKTAVDAILYAEKFFEIITFGPEDASRTEPDFLHEIYREAIQAGAINIAFTDTVGILTPGQAADAITAIQDRVPNVDDAMLSVHFHNDLGLATANALAAVQAGANIVQGTINGIGERAGNMPIEELVLAITLHRDEFGKDVTFDPQALAGLSALVAQLTGVQPASNKAVVGRNIFRTESGLHQDGLLKNPETYLPFQPDLIGAGPVELLLGRHSGRSAVRHHLHAAGMEITEEHVRLVLDYLKGNKHAPEEYAEIKDFLARLRPYLATEEDLARYAVQAKDDAA
jgi:2-isopropylmalate synthase